MFSTVSAWTTYWMFGLIYTLHVLFGSVHLWTCVFAWYTVAPGYIKLGHHWSTVNIYSHATCLKMDQYSINSLNKTCSSFFLFFLLWPLTIYFVTRCYAVNKKKCYVAFPVFTISIKHTKILQYNHKEITCSMLALIGPSGCVQAGVGSASVYILTDVICWGNSTLAGRDWQTVKVIDPLKGKSHQSVCVSLMFQINDYSLMWNYRQGNRQSLSINGHIYTTSLSING